MLQDKGLSLLYDINPLERRIRASFIWTPSKEHLSTSRATQEMPPRKKKKTVKPNIRSSNSSLVSPGRRTRANCNVKRPLSGLGSVTTSGTYQEGNAGNYNHEGICYGKPRAGRSRPEMFQKAEVAPHSSAHQQPPSKHEAAEACPSGICTR